MPVMTNLETIREARGMSRNALAVKLGVVRNTIVKLEEGQTYNPSYHVVMEIAKELAVDHTALFLPAGSTVVLGTEQAPEPTEALS